MTFELLSVSLATILVVITSIFIIYRLRPSRALEVPKMPEDLGLMSISPESIILCKNLATALPNSVIFPHDVAAFKKSMNSYWAQQECEVIPACVVRPRDAPQLSTAVTILKQEHDKREKDVNQGKAKGIFAIRGGGHSPISGAASIKGGVVIDLGLFSEVLVSEDGSSVTIGAGAKWLDVFKVLDEKGLAVVGGRNSAVGVGGLTLGGKILISPHLLSLDF
jgi:hypothetical protein